MKSNMLRAAGLGALVVAMLAPATANAATAKQYFIDKNFYGATIRPATDLSLDTNGQSAPVLNTASPFVIGFEGVSQYDAAAFGRNFIPPDTNGAVGLTQYMEVSNGAYAVFDKYTGTRTGFSSDVAFWAGAGQVGANGDSRVMYNADAKRWIVASFGGSVSDIQIAVSDTDNALGGWKSVKFTGLAGGTADYPTLALDKTSVYIGTNDFRPGFIGTTVNIIPINSLFGTGAPTVANMKQITTPYTGGPLDVDNGFAQQGVNSSSSGPGHIVAASLFAYDNLSIAVTGATSSSAAGASLGTAVYLNQAAFVTAGPGRQPNAIADVDINLLDSITSNNRVVATLDERISSSVYEANGRIYVVHTVNSLLDTLDEARVRYTVFDATTNAILDEGDLGAAGYDFFQGSIAVNRLGQVVIGYNRSGRSVVDGKIRFYAATFNTDANGKLVATNGGPLLLKESLIDDYHNGSVAGQVANGRQRWGDYSQVSVDPSSSHGFYLIGQFAREYNNAASGHPGGTGGSRWGTFIAGLDVGSVPEPASWAMMITGFGLIGASMRRQRKLATVTA